MFGLTFDKLLLIGVVAAFLIGPDRLPHYAAQLARLVKRLKAMADGAKDRLGEEIGEDVDWKKLDPRQYDPRRIVREAIEDEVTSIARPKAKPVGIAPTVRPAPEVAPTIEVDPTIEKGVIADVP